MITAALASGVGLPTSWHRLWRDEWYPGVQVRLTPLSATLPIAALDLLVLLVLMILARTAWAVWRRRLSPLTAARRVVAGAAGGWLVLLGLWGWHYQTEVLEVRLAAGREPGTTIPDPADERARAVVAHAIARLNALHGSAHARPWPSIREASPHLAAALTSAAGELGIAWQPRLPAARTTWLDPYFRRAGIDGLTNPFGLEVILSGSLLDVERPFVLAHEWAHLAGFADEADASFVGWMAGVRLGGQHEYAAWIGVLPHLMGAVPRADGETLLAGLDEGPRTDLRAIAARARERWPAVQDMAWRVYDGFLQANRVAEGVARYDKVTRLVLMAADEQTGRLRPTLSSSPAPDPGR